MRKKQIVGNWKMNGSLKGAKEYLDDLLPHLHKGEGFRVRLAVPYTLIFSMAKQSLGYDLEIGAENMHEEEFGPFTGEISSSMIQEVGATFVLLGHSERRQWFGETSEKIKKKLQRAFACGLEPLICIGETLAEKESGQTKSVLQKQILDVLGSFSVEEVKQVTLAYEPVWAIGTGKSATEDLAEEMHRFCREVLFREFGANTADFVPILYGGSVTESNASILLKKENIDGALIGGASLRSSSFLQIMKSL